MPRKASLDTFVRSVELLRDKVPDFERYPFNIPAIRHLTTLELHPKVTFLVGENGSGKSTLIEAIAVAAGFNPEGGTTNFRFATHRNESELHRYVRLARGVRRPRTGYFLRAESFFNVATNIEQLDAEPSFGPPVINSYGGKYLHQQSHGESFLALVKNRFGARGLYILDEPEAALSPQRQLVLLKLIHQLVQENGSQMIIATHSPLVLAYPDSTIFSLDGAAGPVAVDYEHTEHFALTRDFLADRTRYLRRLFAEEDVPPFAEQRRAQE